MPDGQEVNDRMGYLLRFVQKFDPSSRAAFLELERQFAALEREAPEFPKGRRYVPLAGRDPGNAIVWECEFATLAALGEALALLERDERHERLYRQQAPYFQEVYTEIYETFE
mgnify:CR=1 FL=1